MAYLVLLLAVLLSAAPAVAEELVLGLTGQVGYDDNVFFAVEDQEQALPYRLIPFFELQRRQGDLRYRLRGQVSREDFFDLSGADTTDELLRVTGSWHAGARTDVTFSESFSRAQSLSRRLQALDPADVVDDTELVTEFEVTRTRSTRNAANVSIRRFLSRRWAVELALNHSLLDFQDPDFFDSMTVGGSGNLTYMATSRDRVGFGLGVTQQQFDSETRETNSGTTFVRLFGIWTHQFTPSWKLDIEAGPTLVSADSGDFPTTREVDSVAVREVTPGEFRLVDVTTCPIEATSGLPILTAGCRTSGDPLSPAAVDSLTTPATISLVGTAPKTDDQRLTYFARVALTRQWENRSASFTYTRTESNSSGLGRSTVNDSVVLRGVWEPSRRWRFSTAATWSSQQSAADQVFSVEALQPQFQVVDGQLRLVGVADSLRLITIGTDDKFISYALLTRADWRITRRTTLFGLLHLRRYEREFGALTNNNQTDSMVVFFGIRWQTDPLHL